MARADSSPAVSRAAAPRASVATSAVSPADYQALRWRLIGPFRGGRALAVAGIPGDSRHFYFGAVDGGVWETRDAGRTWRPIFDHEPVGSIGAIAIAPSRPSTIYVGTGEADMRSDIAQGDGMYKSTDGGAHWTHIGLADTRQIASIIVDPQNPERVFVAALGHPYGANAERGVFRTLDGGRHWTKVLYLNPDTGAADLAFKPGDPSTIYAAMWQTRRPPWSVYPPSNGPGSGLYVSHDGGSHWTHIIGNGFPAHPGRIGIAVAPTRPERVYALVAGNWKTGGLYRSDDGGVHWRHVSRDWRIFRRCWYFCALTVDPSNANRVYVMNTIVLRSDDGGKRFIALKGDPTGDDFHQLWIDPTDTHRMILGSDQGVQVTLDGGKTWSSWYNQPTAQVYHISTDNRFPFWVYGTQQDSGAFALPSRTIGADGITMEQFREITPGGENGYVVPDPKNPNIIYGDGTGNTTTVLKLDVRTGQVRDVDPTLAYPDAHYRTAWTLPLVFSPYDHRTLYFANQYLFSTDDGGLHWRRISPDLSRKNPGVPPNVGSVTATDAIDVGARRGVIYSIAPSPFTNKVIWVGTDDGLVWRTEDGGARWLNVTPKALTPWSKVACIELSHFHPATAYLAIDRHRLDDETPYIYVTRNDGRSWTLITNGIPHDDFVNVVREDPVKPGLLYAGTEYGVFVSFDDGAHWQSLQLNLPNAWVKDLLVHDGDLIAATQGRALWVLDDLAPLRQLTPAVVASPAHLFAPEPAWRVHPDNNVDTPLPSSTPQGQNPPAGAILDYWIGPHTRGPVSLSIYDLQGQRIRRFVSDAPPASIHANRYFAKRWLKPAERLSATPGMHRFIWNLRYRRPPAIAYSYSMQAVFDHNTPTSVDGPYVLPGLYRVVLSAGGQTYRAPLVVRLDPREHVSSADLRALLAYSQSIGGALGRVKALYEAQQPVHRALTRLQGRIAAGRAPRRLAGSIARLTARTAGTGSEGMLTLNRRLGALEASAESADRPPTVADEQVLRGLIGQFKTAVAHWHQTVAAVERLNAQLRTAGLAPIALAPLRTP